MKRYTVEEANELLPYLAPALVELREKSEHAATIGRSVKQAAATNGGSHRREEWATLMTRVQELMARIAGWDVQVRDVSTGLVDFPAEIHGREAFLCWRLGEPEVAYWHGTDEGFSGRRPL